MDSYFFFVKIFSELEINPYKGLPQEFAELQKLANDISTPRMIQFSRLFYDTHVMGKNIVYTNLIQEKNDFAQLFYKINVKMIGLLSRSFPYSTYLKNDFISRVLKIYAYFIHHGKTSNRPQ